MYLHLQFVESLFSILERYGSSDIFLGQKRPFFRPMEGPVFYFRPMDGQFLFSISGLWRALFSISGLWKSLFSIAGLWRALFSISGLWRALFSISGLWMVLFSISGLWMFLFSRPMDGLVFYFGPVHTLFRNIERGNSTFYCILNKRGPSV